MRLSFERLPSTIYCIGDSHCLSFSDFLFRDQVSDVWFNTKSLYLSDHSWACSFVDQQGQFNAKVSQTLVDAGILDGEGVPRHLSEDSSYLSTTFITGQAAVAPPMLMFAGGVDLPFIIFNQFKGHDFSLPGETPYPGVEPGCTAVPYQAIRAGMVSVVKPFLFGVSDLHRRGLGQIMVHALPPGTTDDELFRARLDFSFPAARRYKLTIVWNDIVREFCSQNGIAFIDPWPRLVSDGWLRPEYELDGLHLNREAAKISLEMVVETLMKDGRDRTNQRRHAMAARRLGEGSPAQAPSVMVAASAKEAEDMRGGLEFGTVRSNPFPRLCWTSRESRDPDRLAVAEPSQPLLDRLRDLLFGEAGALSQAEVPATIFSCRPCRLLPGEGPAPSLGPALPAGLSRGFLLLSDGQGDHAPLEYTDADTGAVHPLGGAAGALIVCSSRVAGLRLRSPAQPVDLIEFCIGPRFANQPPRVVWAGMNLWPADPFQYSVAGFTASPPFGRDAVSVRPEVLTIGPLPGERG